MKGIVLARGSSTRLYTITNGVSKFFLIYDKTMAYYLIRALILAGIWKYLII